jgi:L-cystine uptake protein TcyP (sodium:dicarboxylate symporter family)
MAEQNYKNHTRWVPLWHFVVYPLILATIAGAAVNLHETCEEQRHENLYSASLILLISIILLLLAFFARHFALKAQDRAIRAEENIRYMGITGKLLDPKLSIKQIIALRFASNNEMLDLERMAVENNLSPKEIKQAIKHWRADHDRV